MQVKWLFAAAMVVVYVGCDFRETGNYGEINKIQNGNCEYLIIWEKPVNEKSDTIVVKLRYMIAGAVKKDFFIVACDDFTIPQFTMNLDKSRNRITAVSPYGTIYEFQCE